MRDVSVGMVRGETQAAPRSAFDLSSSRLPRWFLFSSIHPPGARRPPIHPRKIFASCPLFRLLHLRLYLSHSLPSAELLLTSFLRFFSSTLQLFNSGSSFKMDAPSTNDSPQPSASPRLAARLVQRSAHIATRTCTHPARRGPPHTPSTRQSAFSRWARVPSRRPSLAPGFSILSTGPGDSLLAWGGHFRAPGVASDTDSGCPLTVLLCRSHACRFGCRTSLSPCHPARSSSSCIPIGPASRRNTRPPPCRTAPLVAASTFLQINPPASRVRPGRAPPAAILPCIAPLNPLPRLVCPTP